MSKYDTKELLKRINELEKERERLKECERALRKLAFTVMNYGVEESSLVMTMAFEKAIEYFNKYGEENE